MVLNKDFREFIELLDGNQAKRKLMVLKQRYFLSTKTFELHDKKIIIKESSVFEDKEWEAKFDEIGLDLVKIKSREGIGNAVLFGGLLLITSHMTFKAFTDETDTKLAFLFLFFCFMWGTVFWWSIQKYFAAHFVLSGGSKTLTFFISSPNEKSVREFIEYIKLRVKHYLKEELTTFDPDLTYQEQLENLKYLKRTEVLTQAEFEAIKLNLRERHLLK